jgi:hypothetical protein
MSIFFRNALDRPRKAHRPTYPQHPRASSPVDARGVPGDLIGADGEDLSRAGRLLPFAALCLSLRSHSAVLPPERGQE